jgi:hypothetical protein
MAVRASAGDHHGVRDRRFAVEIDGDGVLGLHVVKAREDAAEGLLGVGTLLGVAALGDWFGRCAAGADPRG